MGLLAAASLALVLPASAASSWVCTNPDERGIFPKLVRVLECQKAARARYIEKLTKKKRREPSPEEIDRFDDFQRAEVRGYSERHPHEATVDGERDAERVAEAGEPEQGFVQRVLEAVGLGAAKVVEKPGGKAAVEAPPTVEAEGRKALGLLKDGARMGEVDLEAAAEKARQDPTGTLKKAVTEHNHQFDRNVPDEVKKFYKKPGASAEAAPDSDD